MIFTLASLLVIVLAVTIFRWITSIPLIRTLSLTVDQWADGVHGQETEPLR